MHQVQKITQNIPTEITEVLQLSAGESVWVVERLREINGEVVILDIDYFNATIIKTIDEQIASNSLYEYIENVLEKRISFCRKEITVIHTNIRDQVLLDMGDYDVLACVTSYTYLESGVLFQYTVSKHRPDKFRFVDFARR